MNVRFLKIAFAMAVPLLLASCSQDELADGNTLPEGKYPLEIASATISVEGGEAQPWGADAPQSRVSETGDGNGSTWDGGEEITVQLYGKTTTYQVADDKTNLDLTGEQLYWQSKAPQIVTAWYPADENIDLSNQTDKLAYVLKATEQGSYDAPVTFHFSHRLAKVRVMLTGEKADDVNQMEIYSYTQCTHTNGDEVKGTSENWITMKECDYTDIGKCWEANVVPGYEIKKFQVNEAPGTFTTSVTPETGKVHEIIIKVKEQVKDIDLSEGSYTITDDGNYTVSGNYTNALIIQGSPTVTLNNASITRDGGGIIIKSGNPTFILEGTNNLSNATGQQSFETQPPFTINGENTNVTIQGEGTLVVDATKNNQNSIGAIGPNWGEKCGNINIMGGTVKAYANSATGIGAYDGGSCGNITIKNATIDAKGWPAIGSSNGGHAKTNNVCGDILIESSNVSASMSGGWSSSPAIGAGGGDDGSQMHCGTITITNTNMTRSQILSSIIGQNVKIGKGEITNGSTNSCGLITITGSDGTQTYSGNSGVPN